MTWAEPLAAAWLPSTADVHYAVNELTGVRSVRDPGRDGRAGTHKGLRPIRHQKAQGTERRL